MQLLVKLLLWILLWSIGWTLWIFLLKRGINYIRNYRLASLYFLSFSLISWAIFHNYLNNFLHKLPLKIVPFLFLTAFYTLSIIMYQQIRKTLKPQHLEVHHKKLIFFATMDYRFLFSKSFDILSQQLLFLTLVLILKNTIPNPIEIVLLCSAIFGAIHIPLLITKHNIIAPYFITASFLAGGIFSLLILMLPYGFLYAYITHWSFYIIAGLVVNKRQLQKNFSY